MTNRTIKDSIVDDETIYEHVGTEASGNSLATREQAQEVDNALNLQMISIRLQSELVQNLKDLSKLHGIGYQPLIREILTRWVNAEMKQVANQYLHELRSARSITAIPEITMEPQDLKEKKCA